MVISIEARIQWRIQEKDSDSSTRNWNIVCICNFGIKAAEAYLTLALIQIVLPSVRVSIHPFCCLLVRCIGLWVRALGLIIWTTTRIDRRTDPLARSLSSCAHAIVFSDSSYKTFCESRTKSINNPKCMHVNAEQERDQNNVRLCLKIWFKVCHNRYNFVDIKHARSLW